MLGVAMELVEGKGRVWQEQGMHGHTNPSVLAGQNTLLPCVVAVQGLDDAYMFVLTHAVYSCQMRVDGSALRAAKTAARRAAQARLMTPAAAGAPSSSHVVATSHNSTSSNQGTTEDLR